MGPGVEEGRDRIGAARTLRAREELIMGVAKKAKGDAKALKHKGKKDAGKVKHKGKKAKKAAKH